MNSTHVESDVVVLNQIEILFFCDTTLVQC